MKILPILGLCLIFSCSHRTESEKDKMSAKARAESTSLQTIAQFKGAQVTGVTISKDGRMFANFPRWRDNLPYSVVEIENGKPIPYPDKSWNEWHGKPEKNKFTCVQSVVAHGSSLFVLDPSNPMMKGVTGKPTLYEFDLASNKLKNSWAFDQSIAPSKSYLNDLRVDDAGQQIFITDSGLGAIVVLDLKTGKATRNLAHDPSTKAEDFKLVVNEKVFAIDGKPAKVHSDGIAYNPKERMIYYHALTGKNLYRVPASSLNAESVENMGPTPAPDGMIFDKDGNLYMADLENNAIVYRTPMGEIKTLIQDDKIGWADTFAIDPENNLVFTDSKLNETQMGKQADDVTFSIYRVPLPL